MTQKNLIRSIFNGGRGGLPSEILSDNKLPAVVSKDQAVTDWRLIAAVGYGVIILTFGVAGVWAAVAKIDAAVIATGDVTPKTNIQTIEHFEGGMVHKILVHEGQHVVKGQILFELQKIQAQATDSVVRTQLDSDLALEARLIAERDRAPTITWPKAFAGRKNGSVLSRVIADQTRQFVERRASINNEIDILEKRVTELQDQIKGIATEKASTEQQVAYVNKELGPLRDLGAKQLVPMSRVYAMERERTRLQGIIGGADADIAKAKSSIGEVKLQMQQIRQKFQEEVAANLLDIRQKIADLQQRARVAQDVLNRDNIRSPLSGTLQNLKVFTIGQVVHPGEPLVELVPDNEPLMVEAKFLTTDIDHIHAGMKAEIRFPAFHSRTIPTMMGTLQSVSHDRLFDQLRRMYYYRGLISLQRADIPKEYRARIRPGMPAEILVSGGARTVMSYLISPLTESLHRAFREPNN